MKCNIRQYFNIYVHRIRECVSIVYLAWTVARSGWLIAELRDEKMQVYGPRFLVRSGSLTQVAQRMSANIVCFPGVATPSVATVQATTDTLPCTGNGYL